MKIEPKSFILEQRREDGAKLKLELIVDGTLKTAETKWNEGVIEPRTMLFRALEEIFGYVVTDSRFNVNSGSTKGDVKVTIAANGTRYIGQAQFDDYISNELLAAYRDAYLNAVQRAHSKKKS